MGGKAKLRLGRGITATLEAIGRVARRFDGRATLIGGLAATAADYFSALQGPVYLPDIVIEPF